MLPGPILPSTAAALMLPAPDQRDGSREECYPAGGGRDLVALHKPAQHSVLFLRGEYLGVQQAELHSMRT